MIPTLAFYLFASVLVASAVMVVTSRNPVHSVLFLILAFFNAAALFLIAGAEFLAMILVIVYVGAVAVLFLFVVKMLDIDFSRMREGFQRYFPIGAAVGGVLFLELLFVLGAWRFGETATTLRGTPRPAGVGNVTSLDEFLKRSRERLSDGLPPGRGRSIWIYALLGFVALWLVFTSIHRVGPQERGVVTTLGDYSRTLGPGMHVTFPVPIDRVETLDVDNVRRISMPTAGTGENLVLTGDQNIVDLAYSVRWNVRDPEQYLFQIANPDDTIPEVAESAMRAVVANFTLDQAIGEQRGLIESRVQELMQRVLDGYRAGVRVQGVEIRQAAAPAAVNEAFNAVIEAQQRSQSALNQARSYASQVTARAQGDAAQFDRVYEEYRQAPEVTRRRIYYETMEQVLSKVDKTVIEASGVTPYLALPEVNRSNPRPAPTSPGARGTATTSVGTPSGSTPR